MVSIRAGNTLLIPGGHKEALHLFLVLTDPDPKTGKVVTVMVVSERRHNDRTVTLVAGEHPFIRHNSNVDYGTGRLFPPELLQGLIESGKGKHHKPMSTAMLEKVRAGLLDSSRTSNELKDYCRDRFGCK